MSLFAVREQLIQRGPSTVNGLAVRLKLSPGTVETMLEHWVKRGRVEIVDVGCHTGGR